MPTKVTEMEEFLSKLSPEDAKCILNMLKVEGTVVRHLKMTEEYIEVGFENRTSYWTIKIVPAIKVKRLTWENT